MSNAVRAHEAFDSSTANVPVDTRVEVEFQREMEAHYLAFSATGTDVDTFDRLFSRFTLMELEPEAPSRKRRVQFGRVWGVVVLLAVGLVVLPLMTQSIGPRFPESSHMIHAGPVGQLREEARQSLRENDFQTTVTLLNELLGNRTETARVCYDRGYAYFRLENHGLALENFYMAATLDPSTEHYRRAVDVARYNLRFSLNGKHRLSTTDSVDNREDGAVQPSILWMEPQKNE